ncbi:hypothetical protein GCM10027035_26760 [Emticicia sediminis]
MIICENVVFGKYAKAINTQKKRKNFMVNFKFIYKKMIGRYHLSVYLLGKAFSTYSSKNQVVIKYFRAKIFPKRKEVSTKF